MGLAPPGVKVHPLERSRVTLSPNSRGIRSFRLLHHRILKTSYERAVIESWGQPKGDGACDRVSGPFSQAPAICAFLLVFPAFLFPDLHPSELTLTMEHHRV